MIASLGVEHEGEISRPDAADEGSVRLGLDRAFVDEGVHVVNRPVAVTLDAQPVAQVLVLEAALVEICCPGVDGLQDLYLHGKLGDGLGLALRLDQLLDLSFEVGDLLLVVVHPRTNIPPASGSGSAPKRTPRQGWR